LGRNTSEPDKFFAEIYATSYNIKAPVSLSGVLAITRIGERENAVPWFRPEYDTNVISDKGNIRGREYRVCR
jgi:hypothetical protein